KATAMASDGQVLEAEVVRHGTAEEALTLIGQPPLLDVAPAWSGMPGRSSLLGLAVVVDPDSAEVAWLPSDFVADATIRAALTDGRPIRAHQAKALLRGLDALGTDVGTLAMDTAIAAYLLDPAETRYGVGDLLERYTGDTLPVDGAPVDQLDFGAGGADVSMRAAREALAVSRLAPALAAALEAQGMAGL